MENWRRTGAILAAAQLDDGQLLVQAVMNNDLEAESVFRVRDDANTLHIVPLPYSLEGDITLKPDSLMAQRHQARVLFS